MGRALPVSSLWSGSGEGKDPKEFRALEAAPPGLSPGGLGTPRGYCPMDHKAESHRGLTGCGYWMVPELCPACPIPHVAFYWNRVERLQF